MSPDVMAAVFLALAVVAVFAALIRAEPLGVTFWGLLVCGNVWLAAGAIR